MRQSGRDGKSGVLSRPRVALGDFSSEGARARRIHRISLIQDERINDCSPFSLLVVGSEDSGSNPGCSVINFCSIEIISFQLCLVNALVYG